MSEPSLLEKLKLGIWKKKIPTLNLVKIKFYECLRLKIQIHSESSLLDKIKLVTNFFPSLNFVTPKLVMYFIFFVSNFRR